MFLNRYKMFFSAFFFMMSSVNAEEQIAISNSAFQLKEEELKSIAQVLIKKNNFPVEELSSAHINNIAREFIVNKILANKAIKKGLDSNESVIKLIEIERNNVLANSYIDDYLANLKQPDFFQIAKENYILNKESFRQPETVEAQHILIAIKGDLEQAQQQALEVREQLLADVSSFSELAKKYSQDPSVKNNGGKLGVFSRDQMVKEFSDVAFSLEVGEISQPVVSQFGVHIIQVLDKKSGGIIPFENVKDGLLQKAKQDFIDRSVLEQKALALDSDNLYVDESVLLKIVNDLRK